MSSQLCNFTVQPFRSTSLSSSLPPPLPSTADPLTILIASKMLPLDQKRIPNIVPKPHKAHPVVCIDDSYQKFIYIICMFLCT